MDMIYLEVGAEQDDWLAAFVSLPLAVLRHHLILNAC
jgi:hypothetical protein